MKKILFVIDTIDVGGATKLTFDLIKLLNKEQFDVEILYLNHHLYGDNNLIKYYNLESKSKLLWYKNFRSLKRVIYMFKNFRKYDLVHSCMEQSNFYSSFVRALPFSKTKLMITYHGLDSVYIKGGTLDRKGVINKHIYTIFMKHFQNHLYRKTDRFVAVCQDIKNFLTEYRKVDPFKVSVVYHGLNFNYLKSTTSKNDNSIQNKSKTFVIGYVGRLGYSKGLEGLVEIIPKLIKQNNGINIIIKGNGELENYLKGKIMEYGLTEQVSFENFEKKVINFYKKIDLLVLPSLYETTNLTVLEAMHEKTIVLSSNAGGLPEIIEDRINGFLFKTNDFEDLLNKISYIRNISESDKDLIRRNALQTVNKKFDLSKNVILVEKEFLSVMES